MKKQIQFPDRSIYYLEVSQKINKQQTNKQTNQ
jgi:hypothetical protein